MAENDNNRAYQGATVGYSMLNVLGNIAYAGMRAQNSQDKLSRTISFWVGFPGTLFSYFLVDEGSERAFGVDLPRRRSFATQD
jgi:hypothetical protein